MMQYIIYIIQYNTQYTNNRQYNTRRIKYVKIKIKNTNKNLKIKSKR